MDSPGMAAPAGGRKRLLSGTSQSFTERKRPRISSGFQTQFIGDSSRSTLVNPTHLERLPRRKSFLDDDFFAPQPTSSRSRALGTSASFSGLPKNVTPRNVTPTEAERLMLAHVGLGLTRSASIASFQSVPSTPTYAEHSAFHNLRNTKFMFDFSTTTDATSATPLSWSSQNIVLFNRGSRVHYKNLASNEDIGQLCKIPEARGTLTAIESAGVDQPSVVAIGTAKGIVQIWDIAARKMTTSWSTPGVASMSWNGAVLSIGGYKGNIKNYDTRVKETSKMKEQAKKVTRHQARISNLVWNVDGKILASGDASGMVYCWDARQTVPLDVGEFVQRRKKMQHAGVVTALAWCPWQPKLLASGDSSDNGTGTIRLWNVNPNCSDTNAVTPGKIDCDAQVTSIHFSPHCREIMSTHGPGAVIPSADGTATPNNKALSFVNSVVVHSLPSLRHITSGSAEKKIDGSVISPNGLKVLLAMPEERQLKIWEVWGKTKDLRRQPSFMDRSSIR